MPWLVFGLYGLSEFSKNSEMTKNIDTSTDTKYFIENEASPAKQLEALNNLQNMTESYGDMFSCCPIQELMDHNLMEVFKKGICSQNNEVARRTAILLGQVSRNIEVAEKSGRDQDLLKNIVTALHDTLPFNLKALDKAQDAQSTGLKENIVDLDIGVDMGRLFSLIKTLAAISRTLTESHPKDAVNFQQKSGLPSLHQFLQKTEKLTAIDSDLLLKLVLLLKIKGPESVDKVSILNDNSARKRADELSQVDLVKMKLVIQNMQRDILLIISKFSKNSEMVHLLGDKIIIIGLLNSLQEKHLSETSRLLVFSSVMRIYKHFIEDFQKLKRNVPKNILQFGPRVPSGLSLSAADVSWFQKQLAAVQKNFDADSLPMEDMLDTLLPHESQFQYLDVANAPVLHPLFAAWGAFRGLLDCYSQKYLPEALKKSCLSIVVKTVAKTVVGAAFLHAVLMLPSPLLERLIQQHGQKKDSIATGKAILATRLGAVYVILRLSPYAFAPTFLWLCMERIQFGVLLETSMDDDSEQ